MDNISFETGFEETLRRCQDMVKTFRGSEKTLKYIKRIEECLRRLVDEAKAAQQLRPLA